MGLCTSASLCADALVASLGLRSVFGGRASAPILCRHTANYWPGMHTATLSVFCGDASTTAITFGDTFPFFFSFFFLFLAAPV